MERGLTPAARGGAPPGSHACAGTLGVGGMNFWVTYPLIPHPYNPELTTKATLSRFCEVAEASGFAGIGFTDHPAPTHKWLNAGGHDALDPFTALSFCATVTDRLRLIPNILVLPYRNPFLVAKAAATLDALSGGRFTLAVATGYMRGEYQALGVDFDQRNALFDEAIEVIRGVWSHDEFAYEGTTFTARGQSANPKPTPHPPIWIGGNSRLTPHEVARYGDGWSPFPRPQGPGDDREEASPRVAGRSPPPCSTSCGSSWRRRDETPPRIDVSFGSNAGGDPGTDAFDPEAQLATTEELAALGVTWCGVGVPGDSLAHTLETLERFGKSVIR